MTCPRCQQPIAVFFDGAAATEIYTQSTAGCACGSLSMRRNIASTLQPTTTSTANTQQEEPMDRSLVPGLKSWEESRVELGRLFVALFEAATRVATAFAAFERILPGPDPSWTNEQLNAWLFKVRP